MVTRLNSMPHPFHSTMPSTYHGKYVYRDGSSLHISTINSWKAQSLWQLVCPGPTVITRYVLSCSFCTCTRVLLNKASDKEWFRVMNKLGNGKPCVKMSSQKMTVKIILYHNMTGWKLIIGIVAYTWHVHVLVHVHAHLHACVHVCSYAQFFYCTTYADT